MTQGTIVCGETSSHYFPFFLVTPGPKPSAGSEARPTGSDALLIGSEGLPAAYEALPVFSIYYALAIKHFEGVNAWTFKR